MNKEWKNPQMINLAIQNTNENEVCPFADYTQGEVMPTINNPAINPSNCKMLINGLCYHDGRFNQGNGKNWPCPPAPMPENKLS